MDGNEIKFMMDYLGFPCTIDSVKDLMAAVDIDSNSTISFEEFRDYVGSMGGCGKMFEDRRAQIHLRHASSDLTHMDKETIRLIMKCSNCYQVVHYPVHGRLVWGSQNYWYALRCKY